MNLVSRGDFLQAHYRLGHCDADTALGFAPPISYHPASPRRRRLSTSYADCDPAEAFWTHRERVLDGRTGEESGGERHRLSSRELNESPATAFEGDYSLDRVPVGFRQ